jgi:hypothetical protein
LSLGVFIYSVESYRHAAQGTKEDDLPRRRGLTQTRHGAENYQYSIIAPWSELVLAREKVGLLDLRKVLACVPRSISSLCSATCRIIRRWTNKRCIRIIRCRNNIQSYVSEFRVGGVILRRVQTVAFRDGREHEPC